MLQLPDRYVAAVPAADPAAPGWWFALQDGRLLVLRDAAGASLPFGRDAPLPGSVLGLGHFDGVPCRALAVPPEAGPLPGAAFVSLRALWGQLNPELLGIAAQAAQLLTWDATHRFCGVCGTPTESRTDERARACPACGHMSYPRVSPAVMVRVTRGEEILLARSPRFAPGVWSILAGFVEAGEALEQTVTREVREEVGLEISGLRYFASQPWPFPHSLMIGFTADWSGGEIAIDGVEIIEAAWFTRSRMPGLPHEMSLSRRLIGDWLQKG